MTNEDTCVGPCDGLCHLNDKAQTRYRELMRGGCPEHAYALATKGVWS